MRRILTAVMLLSVTTTGLAQDEPTAPAKEEVTSPQTPLHPRVKMETSLGDIILQLNAEKAPITVQNFVDYAEAGFFTGTVFHRIRPDFMIQGGGYTVEMGQKTGELRAPIQLEADNGLSNVRGTIAMARTAAPNSATCQFFINVVDNSDKLDPGPRSDGYAVFGEVVEGMETVDKIRDTELHMHPALRTREGAVTPKTPVEIKSVVLLGEYDREAVQARIKELEEERRQAAERAKAEKEKALQELIAKIEQETGKEMIEHESGLKYVILQEGEGAIPKPTDKVKVHYTGTLVDGTKFDSSYDHPGGQPATFGLNQVIKGWTIGVGLMKVGEKRKLILPPELAYGKRGSGAKIGPDATLIFDVELLEIVE